MEVTKKLPSMEYLAYKHDIDNTNYFDLIKFILIAKHKEVLDGLLSTSEVNPSHYVEVVEEVNKIIIEELKLISLGGIEING